MKYDVEIYVDGACQPNPGSMGVGCVLLCDSLREEISESHGFGTNNEAELLAVLVALKRLKHPEVTRVTLYTDSQIVRGLLGAGWVAKKNMKLVAQIKFLIQKLYDFGVHKVPGHSGIVENERCDELAKSAINSGVLV